MDIFVLQIIAIVFVLFALSRSYLRFRERKLSSWAFLFWTLIWIMGVISIINPDFSTKLARLVGIGRGVDAVIYASIVILFYLLFRLYIKVEESERRITDAIRKLALKDELGSSKK